MIIIGEKINGAIPSVAKAIAERDECRIRSLARSQSEAGADFIDVCSAVPDRDVETLCWLIDLVQDACDTPLSIDSPKATSIVEVLPRCRKAGMINSVSLEGDKIDVVFPVIAETGWECVALLCGNGRMPDTAEERIGIFEKIMRKVGEYGISPSRIHIDPMVFSIGTKPDAFSVFAEVARHVRASCPDVHITSGLSNVSFGLPSRKTINQAFMVLAMQAGMDSAILDPTNRDMIGSIFATEALLEIDEYGVEYIGAFKDGRFGVQKVQGVSA